MFGLNDTGQKINIKKSLLTGLNGSINPKFRAQR